MVVHIIARMSHVMFDHLQHAIEVKPWSDLNVPAKYMPLLISRQQSRKSRCAVTSSDVDSPGVATYSRIF